MLRPQGRRARMSSGDNRKLEPFKKYLKANLTHDFVIDGVFRGTLLDAKQSELSDPTGPPTLLVIMDYYREHDCGWWVPYVGHPSAWSTFERNYSTLSIQNRVVSSSIIRYVKEFETNQLSFRMGVPEVYCVTCFNLRVENAALRAKLKATVKATVKAKESTVCQLRPLLREWFEENYHRNGVGRRYSRNQMREDMCEFLTSSFGFRRDVTPLCPIWSWFVQDVIRDESRQYRRFRIWKKSRG